MENDVKNQNTNEIKKIVIKCPREEVEVMSTLPFIVTMSEEYPKADLVLLCEEGTSSLLCFLPFKVKIYERPKHKQSLMETHHYIANLQDLYNVDLFFDLENSLNSAFMGFNLRAKERIGYIVSWNKFFLTKKFPIPLGASDERKSMKLLENYLEKDLREVKISKYKEAGTQIDNIEKLFKEPEPPKFILIMVDNFKNVSAEVELWKNFFDHFQKQKFVIWSQYDENAISDLFSSIDLGHNELYMQRGCQVKEMLYLFNKVKGVVTNNIVAESLCLYLGIDALTLLTKKDSWPHYEFFKFRPQRILIKKEEQTIEHFVYDEVRILKDFNQVIDQIHFNFKL
jgi:ADP-heptose:LPS heptosyltransferase